MNEILPIVLAVSVSILTVTLVVMAINLIAIFSQIKKSLEKANSAIDKATQVVDVAQAKVESILNPFASLSAFITNFTAGLKVTEGFMSWLNRNKNDAETEVTDLKNKSKKK